MAHRGTKRQHEASGLEHDDLGGTSESNLDAQIEAGPGADRASASDEEEQSEEPAIVHDTLRSAAARSRSVAMRDFTRMCPSG